MVIVKQISITFYAVLLAGLVPFASTQNSIDQFITWLKSDRDFPGALDFDMRDFSPRDLKGAAKEFQVLCLHYGNLWEDPVVALNKAVEKAFFHYKLKGNTAILGEIENCDPVGFSVYLRKMNVNKDHSDFMNQTNIFVSTMRTRMHLSHMSLELENIPEDIRQNIATEDGSLTNRTVNYFIEFAAKQTKKKMYPMNLLVLDEFKKYKKRDIDDVQISSSQLYTPNNVFLDQKHAMCFRYKASDKTVEVYDSAFSNFLDGRQKGIIDKLYPRCEIVHKKPRVLQEPDTVTCCVFAIIYATLLILREDPVTYPLKLNKVHSDPTLYMRIHILEMLSKGELSLPEKDESMYVVPDTFYSMYTS